jgi:hypothetical protein
MSHTATCSCGRLSVSMRGEPPVVALCHCHECQKQTGSVFGAWTYWPKSACQSIAGEAKLYRRIAESGRWVDNYFCPHCGSSVYSYAEMAPDEICVATGSFADRTIVAPTLSFWSDCRHPWVTLPAECEQRANDSA